MAESAQRPQKLHHKEFLSDVKGPLIGASENNLASVSASAGNAAGLSAQVSVFEEPGARKPHAGICGGVDRQLSILR